MVHFWVCDWCILEFSWQVYYEITQQSTWASWRLKSPATVQQIAQGHMKGKIKVLHLHIYKCDIYILQIFCQYVVYFQMFKCQIVVPLPQPWLPPVIQVGVWTRKVCQCFVLLCFIVVLLSAVLGFQWCVYPCSSGFIWPFETQLRHGNNDNNDNDNNDNDNDNDDDDGDNDDNNNNNNNNNWNSVA